MGNDNELFRSNQEINSAKPSILVATPFSELGEIIRESLRDVANIDHIQKISQAIALIKGHQDYSQVILDMEFGELSLLNLGKALRLICPTIKIIIISKDENPTDLDEIQPCTFLHKPLLLRDLEAALGITGIHDNFAGEIIDLEAMENDYNAPIRWSSNPSLATRYLSRLIEKSYAQEALLIQNQEVWSFAGRLPEESVHELNNSINKCMAKDSNLDLAKFITLETTQTQHAIYASLILVGVILALVFDADIPLGTVRKQTKEFANTLSILDGNEFPVKSVSSGNGGTRSWIEEKGISRNQMFLTPSAFDDEKFELAYSTFIKKNEIDPVTLNQTATEVKEQTQKKESMDDLRILFPGDESDRSNAEPWLDANDSDSKKNETANNELSSLNEFIPDALYNLTYSCLLIPRFGTHQLTNEREKKIAGCIKNIHTSKGWRLEVLKVRPEYLLWESNFPPNVTPSKHIDIIRKETSRLMFENFPTFKRENPSGDYWAPGYLIVGGKNAISDQLVSAFLRQNRKKHGVGVVDSRSSRDKMVSQYPFQMA
jgi:REP element-mobilizing transposase RayT/CheY-like chemotaxis protein